MSRELNELNDLLSLAKEIVLLESSLSGLDLPAKVVRVTELANKLTHFIDNDGVDEDIASK